MEIPKLNFKCIKIFLMVSENLFRGILKILTFSIRIIINQKSKIIKISKKLQSKYHLRPAIYSLRYYT